MSVFVTVKILHILVHTEIGNNDVFGYHRTMEHDYLNLDISFFDSL